MLVMHNLHLTLFKKMKYVTEEFLWFGITLPQRQSPGGEAAQLSTRFPRGHCLQGPCWSSSSNVMDSQPRRGRAGVVVKKMSMRMMGKALPRGLAKVMGQGSWGSVWVGGIKSQQIKDDCFWCNPIWTLMLLHLPSWDLEKYKLHYAILLHVLFETKFKCC